MTLNPMCNHKKSVQISFSFFYIGRANIFCLSFKTWNYLFNVPIWDPVRDKTYVGITGSRILRKYHEAYRIG